MSRCAPFCRDPRPPARGVARAVADEISRAGIPPEAMSAYLADVYRVGRFADLCYSHAGGIEEGLRLGILAVDLAVYVDP